MNSFYLNTSSLLLVFLITSCTTSNTVSSVDPSADFSQYKTYDFAKTLDTDGAQYQSLESGYLRTAVSRELESRGYSQSDQPDLVINFSIETEEKIVQRNVPRAGGGIGYDPFYDAYYDDWGMTHETRIDQYTEGKLNIDLIDAQAHKVVWQGSTKGRLTKKDYENAQVTLNKAVTEIFLQFPEAR